jgi:hypothetical protein
LFFGTFGGVVCGIIDGRGFPFALGLGEVRLMGGEVVVMDRREENDVDFETEPLEGVLGIVVRRGDGVPIMEVIRVQGECAADAESSSWVGFMGSCVGGEVERAGRTEPVTEGIFLVGEDGRRMGCWCGVVCRG